MVLTIAAVAAHKGISPERVEARIAWEIEESPTWNTRFRIRLDLGSGLTARERSILFHSARACEVHKLLAGQMGFDFSLSPNLPPGRKTTGSNNCAPSERLKSRTRQEK